MINEWSKVLGFVLCCNGSIGVLRGGLMCVTRGEGDRITGVGGVG